MEGGVEAMLLIEFYQKRSLVVRELPVLAEKGTPHRFVIGLEPMNNSTRESPPPGPSWFSPLPLAESQSTVHPGVTQPQENKVAVSVRERIENWFIRPLEKFGSEDVFVCLMVCLPLIEKRVRHELMEAGENERMAFSKGSLALKIAARILDVSDAATLQRVWSASRNGLLHRGMVGGELEYILLPNQSGQPAFMRSGNQVTIYPLIIRDKTVAMLRSAPNKMWTRDSCPLPEVYRLA